MTFEPDRQDPYEERLAQERDHYDGVVEFDNLPPIYHYWSNRFLRPLLEELGCSSPPEFFAHYLRQSAERSAIAQPRFISIGAGDCNNEIAIARLLVEGGLEGFTIECLEMNPSLIERATGAARAAGLLPYLLFSQGDFNAWHPAKPYHGIMANQSLHHVTNLEGLFDAVRHALLPEAFFVTSDMIGRNGHQRWPEARRLVASFWEELPTRYRFNHQLQRHEEQFQDWDCSQVGFEGIRCQDILPLLLERFYFQTFIGFANVVDVFIDRGFGPNFNADEQWDRDFVDRLHACDEREFARGTLTPTHMLAVLTAEPTDVWHYARGLSPRASVRLPDLPLVPTG